MGFLHLLKSVEILPFLRHPVREPAAVRSDPSLCATHEEPFIDESRFFESEPAANATMSSVAVVRIVTRISF